MIAPSDRSRAITCIGWLDRRLLNAIRSASLDRLDITFRFSLTSIHLRNKKDFRESREVVSKVSKFDLGTIIALVSIQSINGPE